MGFPDGDSGFAPPGGGGTGFPDGPTGPRAAGASGAGSVGTGTTASGGGVPSALGRALEMTLRRGSGSGGGGAGAGSGSGVRAARFGIGLPSAASTTRSASEGPVSSARTVGDVPTGAFPGGGGGAGAE